jgi:hypothetical protein
MISSRQRLLWAGLLAGATFAASAQTAVPPAAEAQPGAQAQQQQQRSLRAEQRRDPAQRWERMREHRAQRLAALKQKLQLTPAQEGAWQSFSTASQPPAQAPQRVDRAEFAKLTTPQRLDRMQARQAQRAERLAARAAATRSFYAALTPEQQKVFDTESLHFGPHGDHGHHRHHRHATTGTGAAAPAV